MSEGFHIDDIGNDINDITQTTKQSIRKNSKNYDTMEDIISRVDFDRCLTKQLNADDIVFLKDYVEGDSAYDSDANELFVSSTTRLQRSMLAAFYRMNELVGNGHYTIMTRGDVLELINMVAPIKSKDHPLYACYKCIDKGQDYKTINEKFIFFFSDLVTHFGLALGLEGDQLLDINMNWLDTSAVHSLSSCFNAHYGGIKFEGNVSMVEQFDGDISLWDVSNVTVMDQVFANSNFNGDLSQWDVRNVKTMMGCFRNSAFSGDISMWKVSDNCTVTLMFRKSNVSKEHRPDCIDPRRYQQYNDYTDVEFRRWVLAHGINESYRDNIGRAFMIDDMNNDITSVSTKRSITKTSKVYDNLMALVNRGIMIDRYEGQLQLTPDETELLDYVILDYGDMDDDVISLCEQNDIFESHVKGMREVFTKMLQHQSMTTDDDIDRLYEYMTNENTAAHFEHFYQPMWLWNLKWVCKKFDRIKGVDWFKVFDLDGKCAFHVYVVDEDGNDIPVQEWDPTDNSRARFIKLTADRIYVSTENFIYLPSGCIRISKHWKKMYEVTDWDRANDKVYSYTEEAGDIRYSGHLPTMAEFEALSGYNIIISHALELIGSEGFVVTTGGWWSEEEDEYNDELAYVYGNGVSQKDDKYSQAQVLVLF